LQLGRELSVPMYGTSVVANQMDVLIAKGNEAFDHTPLGL